MNAEAQGVRGSLKGPIDAIMRAVVVTVTLKAVALVALMETVDGTEQVPPVGAPEQLSEAVPP